MAASVVAAARIAVPRMTDSLRVHLNRQVRDRPAGFGVQHEHAQIDRPRGERARAS